MAGFENVVGKLLRGIISIYFINLAYAGAKNGVGEVFRIDIPLNNGISCLFSLQ